MLRTLRSLLSVDYCPILPWWATSGQDALGARLRRLSGRGRRSNRPRRALSNGILLLTWPLRSLLQALRLNAKHGAKARKLSGKGRLRQLLETGFVAGRHFLPARHYYVYELFREQNRRFGLQCLNESETGNLFTWMNQGASSPAIGDKRVFGEWCRERNLPAPPTVACVDPETPIHLPRLDPLSDWFVKPVRGYKGAGCARWSVAGDDVYANESGRSLTREALAKHLKETSQSVPLLVQPFLKNHPEISDLSPGPLAAIRLVTGRYPDGKIVIVAATFKMPKGAAITNNLGVSSRVDLESGRLGPAHAYSPFHGPFDRHPDTNSAIVNRRLPDWETAKSVGLKAHGHLPEYVFLGWDIALTDAGPVILEGNANWDTLSIQKSHNAPLTALPFGDICSEWLVEESARKRDANDTEKASNARRP